MVEVVAVAVKVAQDELLSLKRDQYNGELRVY
jgi:hypothetical protein